MRPIAFSCLALLIGSPAYADPIPFDYSIPPVYVASGSGPNASIVGFGAGGTGAGPTTADFSYSVGTFSSQPWNNVPITLPVTITDDASQGIAGATTTGTLLFTGTLTGTPPDHSTPTFDFNWTNPQQSITLGAPGQLHTYTVTGPETVPGLNANYLGHYTYLSFTITPSDASANGQSVSPTETPEPSTLTLAAIGGLASLGVYRSSRRRLKRITHASQ